MTTVLLQLERDSRATGMPRSAVTFNAQYACAQLIK
jgi:hypothetical protein